MEKCCIFLEGEKLAERNISDVLQWDYKWFYGKGIVIQVESLLFALAC